MSRVINWDAAKLKAVKAALASAVEQRKTSFKVLLPGEREEVEFHCGFARHMIDYVETEFARNPPRDFGPNNEGREGQ